ncbi:MAG: hypothetical protein A2527_03530 [Candidatus Lambdaproteobacteria bacterium RIFOXYD2_FULL_50_16]|uniref:Periplasmic heavy metal sensor n=1 Tax=Candidatus Lambdaproteobacteria bacterium RIFOXYD2_FULL_50_16 TaxID=1817772 RepID=A0A1F6GEV4_9PROT|nr:MAG: hypothetical protein A2527_03530 [Candidatus Lambdaproteobacteria bacterium RIFOXYD2_FULL_50_16]
MKSKFTLAALTAFLALGLAACSHYRMDPEKQSVYILDKLKSELNLTPEQVTATSKIKDEIVAFHKANHPNQAGPMAMGGALGNAVKADQLDKTALKAQMMEHRSQMQAKHETHMDFMLTKLEEFHKILTPEQRIKLAKLIEEHHSKGGPGGRMGMGMGMGFGSGHGAGDGGCWR